MLIENSPVTINDSYQLYWLLQFINMEITFLGSTVVV